MEEEKDTYKTITKPSDSVLFKEKGSKFFGYAFPVTDEGEVKECLANLKKEHFSARHFCYAWQMGTSYENHRTNDDGEPSNSAGMPIYGQLQSFDITNILVVVVRYFGGTKLGVGGLVQAYKTTAQLALEASEILVKTIDESFLLKFQYPEMNSVMRLIKDENLTIINQKMELDCEIEISVRKNSAQRVFMIFEELFKVQIKKTNFPF